MSTDEEVSVSFRERQLAEIRNIISAKNERRLTRHASAPQLHFGLQESPSCSSLSSDELAESLSSKSSITSSASNLSYNGILFNSDASDVREMEVTLQKLLDDFNSGKLKAFGDESTLTDLIRIHEKQEQLAELHFELASDDIPFEPLTEQRINSSTQIRASLMDNLQTLSNSIERLRTNKYDYRIH